MLFDTADIVCGRVYVTTRYPSVCLSHLAPQLQRAAGLLLWARPAGAIDRLLYGASAAGAAAFRSISISTAARRSAANASSVVRTATYEAEHRLVQCVRTA